MSALFGRLTEYSSKLDDSKEREKADYRSPLTYFIMAALLWSINILLFFPALRDKMLVWVLVWDFGVIFILSSMVGQLRFK